MSSLFDESSAAKSWADLGVARHSTGIFGKLVSAVIWTDAKDESGSYVVPVDPYELVSGINKQPYILLHNHDPGQPKGQILEAAIFRTEAGKTFVAAILGYYAGGNVLSFRELGLERHPSVAPPSLLPTPPDTLWLQLATDPREVQESWLADIAQDAPLHIKLTELSHNAAESTQELIRIGVAYALVVWNPFVTAIATEAGKATFAAVHGWLRRLLERLSDLRNPIVVVQATQHDCQVSFIFRGKDLKRNYAAHDALSTASTQAAHNIDNLKLRGMQVAELVYEFDAEAKHWYPSYACLADGRIITDSITLIAIEQLPSGLSLGLSRGGRRPSIKSVIKGSGN